MIDSFACTETKALMKVHSFNINQWALTDSELTVSKTMKEALLASATRLFELIEQLPEHTYTKGKQLNG